MAKIERTSFYSNSIRWCIRSDMPEVLRIDQHHVWERWTENRYLRFIRSSRSIGVVLQGAHFNDPIRGFMFYEIHSDHLYIERMAVNPDDLRCGVGRAMIDRLIDKLSQQKRQRIVADVHDRNVAAQMFFSRCGFRGESMSGDMIRFVYWLDE